MIEDLLSIAKNLLYALNVFDNLTEDEETYIVNVVRKIVFILLIELDSLKH